MKKSLPKKNYFFFNRANSQRIVKTKFTQPLTNPEVKFKSSIGD